MTAALTAIVSTSSAEARESERHRVDIPATSLSQAVAILSAQTGASIGAEGLLPNIRTPRLHGRLTVGEALARLLDGTGHVAQHVGGNGWRIGHRQTRARPVAPVDARPSELPLPPTEIIVTATKRETSLDKVPLAISIVTPGPARAGDATSGSGDIAGSVEGLTLTGLGPGRNRMFLRGIADSAFNGESQATVAVLFDGSRLTYSAPDPDIRLVDVARVEVIKGPQGSLYGTGALGGIYQIIPNPPAADRFGASITGSLTSVSAGGTGGDASAALNLPLGGGRAALRFVGYASNEPGWIDTGSRRNSNRTIVTGGRVALGTEVGGWTVNLSGLLQFIGARDSQYVYAPAARTRPSQLPEPHDNDVRHIAARAKRSGAIDIELLSSMTWHEVGDELDATIGADQFGLADPRVLNDERQYRLLDNELRLSGSSGGIRWLAGLSHVRARQDLDMTLLSASTSLLLDADRRTTTDLALFGNIAVPLAPGLDLDLGGRLFHARTTETRSSPQDTATGYARRTGLTPSAALSWRPKDDRTIFLRYGSAIRQGGSDLDAAGGPSTLDGDELTTVEAGWRERLSHGHIEAGLWYSWWDDVQSDLLWNDGLIKTGNAGKARIVGVEAGATFSFGDGWRLDAGVNYTSALLVRNDLGTALDDRRLPVVPEYVLRGAIARDFRLGQADASLAVRLRYVGPARLSFDPAIDRAMGRLIESRVEGQINLGGFILTASIANLLGEDEDSFAFGNPLRFRSMRQYIPMAPRHFSIGISRQF
ncbi:MAG TPA: TonB-dependent receptor [Sphingopyxis sp.]|nr:TonB-dependent receptor [Sphingopyxis sp.]